MDMMNMKVDSARTINGRKRMRTRWLQTIAQRCALTGIVAFITALAASNILLLSTQAHAAPNVTTTQAHTTTTAATTGYSKHNLRPRFVVPKGHRRNPHTKGSDYKNEPFVATANN